MKKSQIAIIVFLIVLIIVGGFSAIQPNDSGTVDYETAKSKAEEYMDRGLYQLAISEYDKAIAIKDTQELRDASLDAYEKRYQESKDIIQEYINAAEMAVAAYPKQERYYIVLANAYLRDGNNQAAWKTLENARNNGLNSEMLTKLYLDTKYSFELQWESYTEVRPCVNGLYPVSDDGMWGLIDEGGDEIMSLDYAFVTPTGQDGIQIISDEETILVDQDNIVRGKLSFMPQAAGLYQDGLIAIKKDDAYGFYNSLGDFVFGDYLVASNFCDGKAAVCNSSGAWCLVDASGESISDVEYQEIKLNLDGSYNVDGIMLAKVENQFWLCDENGKQKESLKADDVDVLTEDGLIAYEINGKWGFVDTSGNVIIEPQFEGAKSFSHGLAAICKDEKWGFINEAGEIAIEYQFVDADYFNSEMNCFVKTSSDGWQMLQLKVKS